MDDATCASPDPAACRREGRPSRVIRQVSGRGGEIVFRCTAKQTRRYNRDGRHLCTDKPNTPHVIATGCGGRRLCVSHRCREISFAEHYHGGNAGELGGKTRRSATRFQRRMSARAADIRTVLNLRGAAPLASFCADAGVMAALSTSVPEWDRQFRLVRVHHEYREELDRLRLAGIGADGVAVPGVARRCLVRPCRSAIRPMTTTFISSLGSRFDVDQIRGL